MQISIANPCSERLDESGYCERCQQTVHDLSKLTRTEALELYYKNNRRLCARLTRDPNGQVEFRTEPPSAVGKSVRASIVGLAMAGGATAAESCAVEVRVTDITGAGVANASVSLLARSGDPVLKGQTDVLGVFRQQVARGSYMVRAEASGFRIWSREIACRDNVKIDAVLDLGVLTGEVVVVDSVPSPLRKAQFALRRLFRAGSR